MAVLFFGYFWKDEWGPGALVEQLRHACAAGAVVAMVGYVVGAAMDSVIVVAAVQLGAAVASAAALAGANHQAAVTAPAGTG